MGTQVLWEVASCFFSSNFPHSPILPHDELLFKECPLLVFFPLGWQKVKLDRGGWFLEHGVIDYSSPVPKILQSVLHSSELIRLILTGVLASLQLIIWQRADTPRKKELTSQNNEIFEKYSYFRKKIALRVLQILTYSIKSRNIRTYGPGFENSQIINKLKEINIKQEQENIKCTK